MYLLPKHTVTKKGAERVYNTMKSSIHIIRELNTVLFDSDHTVLALICKYEIKSQIFTVQMFHSFDQSRTQAVPSAFRLRAESFFFNVFFKSGRPLLMKTT